MDWIWVHSTRLSSTKTFLQFGHSGQVGLNVASPVGGEKLVEVDHAAMETRVKSAVTLAVRQTLR